MKSKMLQKQPYEKQQKTEVFLATYKQNLNIIGEKKSTAITQIIT